MVSPRLQDPSSSDEIRPSILTPGRRCQCVGRLEFNLRYDFPRCV